MYTRGVIVAPPGWTQHFGAHLITLYPPEGGGRIRFYERIRPVQKSSQILRFVLDRDPAFRVSSVSDPLEVVTAEGEYGVWVRVNGSREGASAVHFVGAVFTDEFAAALDTLVVLKDKMAMLEATSRELLGSMTLGLGGRRRRRFLYDPPGGWQAIPSGLVANWYPPDFPANNTNIVVYPAEPSERPPSAIDNFLADEKHRGFELHGPIEDIALKSDGGLSGRRWRFAGHKKGRDGLLYRDFVSLFSAPYAYQMRMETFDSERLSENREIFAAVARSAMPIPRPGRYRFGPLDPDAHIDVFLHWID